MPISTSSTAPNSLDKTAPVGDKPETPKPDPEQAEWVDQRWTDVKESFTSYHQMAWEAILMQAGQTWIRWDAAKKVFEPDAPQDDWTPTPRINRFAPTVDSIASNVMSLPEVEATVAGDKEDPLQWGIADVASKLADDWVKKVGLRSNANNEQDKAGQAGMSFVLCGNVFTEISIKSEGIAQIPDMQPQQVMQGACQQPGCPAEGKFNDDMQPVPGTQSFACPACNTQMQAQPGMKVKPALDPATGQAKVIPYEFVDANCDVRLPIFILPRPGSHSMYDTPYTFTAEREYLDYVRVDRNITDADADNEQIDGFSVGYEHALSYWYQGVTQTTKSVQDSALMIRCFVPPGKVKDHPEGFIAYRVNGATKRTEPWPEELKGGPFNGYDHPLTHAVYQRNLVLFFGRSVAFDLAGLQKEYQSYESLIKLHGMTCAVEPIVLDENTIVSAVTGRADKVIKWRSVGPGSKEPHRMKHGQLDDGVYRQRQSLRDEFENVSGAVSVFKGNQPGSITAASAIDKLQGQAEQMFNKPTQNWNSLWKETIRKAVKIRQRRWSVAQIAAVVGQDKLTHIQAFKQCDYDNTLDWVATAHGLPRSRNDKKQEMMMLFDRGALDLSEPNTREKIYELFGELGVMNNFNLDATRARVENRDMKAGKPVVVKPEIEDLGVHLAVHLQTAKELDFDNWPQQSKEFMLTHIMETRQAIAMQMAPPLGPGGAPSVGGPGGPGGPSSPGAPPGAGPQGGGGPHGPAAHPGAHPPPAHGQPQPAGATHPGPGPGRSAVAGRAPQPGNPNAGPGGPSI